MSETPARFYTTLEVRFYETDAQDHVNFVQYFNYFDVALVAYLRAIGYGYQAMLAEGVDIFYVDAHATYLAPARFEDVLRVYCRPAHVGNTSLRFDFEVAADAGGQPIATGSIVVITVNRETGEKTRVPERMRQAFAARQQASEQEQAS